MKTLIQIFAILMIAATSNAQWGKIGTGGSIVIGSSNAIPAVFETNWHSGSRGILITNNNVWGFDNEVVWGTLDPQTVYFYNDGSNPRTMTNFYFMHPDDFDVWDYNSPYFRFERDATLSLMAYGGVSPYASSIRLGYIEGLGYNTRADGSAVGPGGRFGNDIAVTNRVLAFGGVRPASILAFNATANAAVSNSASELTLIGTGVGSLTVSSNNYAAGSVLSYIVRGHINASASRSLQIRVKWDGVTIGDTGVISPNTGSADDGFVLAGEVTFRTSAIAGTVAACGGVIINDQALGGLPINFKLVNAGTVSANTVTNGSFSITAQWSGAGGATDYIYSQTALVRVE